MIEELFGKLILEIKDEDSQIIKFKEIATNISNEIKNRKCLDEISPKEVI